MSKDRTPVMSLTTGNKARITNGHADATYGFIGIGVMGFWMALNVRAKITSSSTFFIFDIDQARIDAFREKAQGTVTVATSPKQIAEECDIIIMSLPAGPAIEQVWSDPTTGLLATNPTLRQRLFLDTSSIPVHTSLELRKQVEDSGFGEFVDCPVSGGIPGAEKGELVFMVGGTTEQLERATPILLFMAKPETVYHCGPAGAGMATKVINNYVASASYIALCEGMNTGVRYGLDPKRLTDIINVSSGMSWNSQHMNPVKGVQPDSSASRDFEGGASQSLAVHAIDMAVELMDQVNAKYVLANVLKHVWAVAGESPLCIGKEYRSAYRLFSEGDGENGLGTVRVEQSSA